MVSAGFMGKWDWKNVFHGVGNRDYEHPVNIGDEWTVKSHIIQTLEELMKKYMSPTSSWRKTINLARRSAGYGLRRLNLRSRNRVTELF